MANNKRNCTQTSKKQKKQNKGHNAKFTNISAVYMEHIRKKKTSTPNIKVTDPPTQDLTTATQPKLLSSFQSAHTLQLQLARKKLRSESGNTLTSNCTKS